jgi:hypothetical protein
MNDFIQTFGQPRINLVTVTGSPKIKIAELPGKKELKCTLEVQISRHMQSHIADVIAEPSNGLREWRGRNA